MSRRVLVVSWEFPPLYGPRGRQVARTVTALPSLGWQPTVVAFEPRRGGPHPIDAADGPPLAIPICAVRSPQEWLPVRAAFRIAPRLRDHPDPARVWVPRAARAAVRLARAEAFAGLITFAQPWSDHLVGLRVRRATKLPWVAHFSDPWSDSPYATSRQRSIWRPMEEEVIREAAAVVFVSEETADLVMKKYPAAWRDKVSVVPHGFSAATSRENAARPIDARPLQLLYTGRFYAGVRTPIPLLRAVAALHRRERLDDALHVTFIGPHVEEYAADARRLGVAALTTFRGRTSRLEVDRMAADADALVVIDAPGGHSVFLPSKLIDYLPFRKPLLGITAADGASGALLRRLGAHVAPPDDEAAIASALEDLIARWRGGTLGVSPSFDAVAAGYDIRNTTARLAAVLQRAFA